MKLHTWDLDGFEMAYSKYYYMPHLNSCDADGIDEHGHQHTTLGECGKASCICAFEDEIITYSKLFFENDPTFKLRAESAINKLNMKPGSSIFVAGCAFGFILEALADKKMNVWGCDNSPYIHFNTETESIFNIQNIDITSNTFKDDVLNEIGVQYFDYVITEDVLTSYDNNGTQTIDDILQNMVSILKPGKPLQNIIHFVDTNCGVPFLTQSLDDWKNINNNHTWLEANKFNS